MGSEELAGRDQRERSAVFGGRNPGELRPRPEPGSAPADGHRRLRPGPTVSTPYQGAEGLLAGRL